MIVSSGQNPQIEIPQSVAELLQDPQRVKDALTYLNLLLNMRSQIVTPLDTRGVATLSVAGQSIILPLPIQFAGPIDDSLATAVSASAQLNLLLAQLRIVGIIPS